MRLNTQRWIIETTYHHLFTSETFNRIIELIECFGVLDLLNTQPSDLLGFVVPELKIVQPFTYDVARGEH